MMRRTLPGPLSTEDLGRGRWRLIGSPDGLEVYLQISGPGVAGVLKGVTVTELDLQWTTGTVQVALARGRSVDRLVADSAFIHEPRPRLYQVLPMAGFDRKARRFWRRVFILMRLPGGRMLLRFLARKRA